MLNILVLRQIGVMYSETNMLNDDGSRVVYSSPPDTWRFIVKTNAWKKEGIFPNDVLVVQEGKKLVNGDWVILDFEGKRIVRQVELLDDSIRFKPLDHSLQPIDWPLHKPAPVIGVVQTIIRQRVQSS
jgi:SOS-response transcriptional repressor LexA